MSTGAVPLFWGPGDYLVSLGLCSSIGHSADEGSSKGALKSLLAIPFIETVHCQYTSSIVLCMYCFFDCYIGARLGHRTATEAFKKIGYVKSKSYFPLLSR